MTSAEHDKAGREYRVRGLMLVAGRSRASAERIDDQSTAAAMAAMEAAERIVNESPKDEQPFINTQMQMILHATLGAMIQIELTMVHEGLVTMATMMEPEQQDKSQVVMPQKDLR